MTSVAGLYSLEWKDDWWINIKKDLVGSDYGATEILTWNSHGMTYENHSVRVAYIMAEQEIGMKQPGPPSGYNAT
jgi:hypothetical protein